ncbi:MULTISPECIES: hypothetical protein [Herpetosiphon]|uniref:DUF4352 domain-containing protein n=1 Tax=Herpetosiphon geysericola TaxID=70996 RepID=A0A0N8GR17_9CHLR|nr:MULTISPECIES: hypothetical protein [Herpetosiphon]KPL85250.1 hypothetical protein SE18_16320 [Herpetosiphon geysericola]MBM7846582.1 hypothetical protein [Herpetosiphon giganteus]
MFSQRLNSPPPALIGVIIALVLIFLVSTRSCNPDSEQTLRSRFAEANATQVASQDLGTPILPLPAPVQEWSSTAIARLQGGEAVVPITPVVTNDKLKVDIQTLQQVGDGLQIKGVVTNISKQELRVPLSAFRFTDQSGTVFAAQGDAAANLPPNANTTLDLTLPIKNPTALTMVVEIPAEDIRLEVNLLAQQQ